MGVSPEVVRREADQDQASARSDSIERTKIQASIADATMKALLLANGGALVALFTFVGNLTAKGASTTHFAPDRLWIAFACFVAGLVAGLICHLLAFFSQDRFYNTSMEEAFRHQRIARAGEFEGPTEGECRYLRQGVIAYFGGFAVAIVSIVLFALGCGFALAGVLIQ